MKWFTGVIALVALLSFGTVATVTYAGDPAPAPTEQKDKKDSGGSKVFSGDEKKEEKKGDKGGKLIFADDEKKGEKKDDKGGK